MLQQAPDKIDSSAPFEAFFQNATMGILIMGSDGKIIAINSHALNEFGYSEGELQGNSIEVIIPERFHLGHRYHCDKYMDSPGRWSMGKGIEVFGLHKNGSEIAMEISLANYQDNDKNYVIAFIKNISKCRKVETAFEKLKAELEATVEKRTSDLQETLQELKKSKDKLADIQAFQKALLDNAGAMIIATDTTGLVKLFNPEAAINLGYRESDVIDQKNVVDLHDRTEIKKKRQELSQEFGLVVPGDFDVLVEKAKRNIHGEEQYTYLRQNGTSFPVLLSVTAIRDEAGIITGFMGIAIDIYKRQMAEEALRDSLKKEKDLNELKSRFVSMASHEFRTPLSTVLSSAYLVQKYTSSNDQLKREKHLQRIVSSVTMLTDILNDFLSLGKIEEGKMQVKFTNCNICEQVKLVIDEMKNSLRSKQKIRYQHKGDQQVCLDSSLLKHIIMNLVSNASKFSPKASNIEINTTIGDGIFQLSVKDHGMGISKEDQKHLMERFFRGTNACSIQGTGLGLHIISKYAELMNGTLECYSELGKGTQFIITFTPKNF
ncbi:MAG: two-component sensor histidine kinase [Ferruginibacter sp.]|nr:two-component sensor histidine kinase [Ferruginibacter sp.]